MGVGKGSDNRLCCNTLLYCCVEDIENRNKPFSVLPFSGIRYICKRFLITGLIRLLQVHDRRHLNLQHTHVLNHEDGSEAPNREYEISTRLLLERAFEEKKTETFF